MDPESVIYTLYNTYILHSYCEKKLFNSVSSNVHLQVLEDKLLYISQNILMLQLTTYSRRCYLTL